jgi:large subunit ribosomal protein L22
MSNSMTATLKYALLSDKKMNLIVKLVQGKKVDEALDVLKFTAKKGARTLYKVVKSARDNAMHDEKTVSDNLYIKRIDVGR